jgi:hypothetical protein
MFSGDDYSVAFGHDLAISGDYLAVADVGDSQSGYVAGAAHFYERLDDQWTHIAKILPDGGSSANLFGYSVDVLGETALVGAIGEDVVNEESGSTYLIKRLDGEWTKVMRLHAHDPAYEDWFGRAVAISGDLAVVGAMYDDDAGWNTGSAYVFSLTSDSCNEYTVNGLPTGYDSASETRHLASQSGGELEQEVLQPLPVEPEIQPINLVQSAFAARTYDGGNLPLDQVQEVTIVGYIGFPGLPAGAPDYSVTLPLSPSDFIDTGYLTEDGLTLWSLELDLPLWEVSAEAEAWMGLIFTLSGDDPAATVGIAESHVSTEQTGLSSAWYIDHTNGIAGPFSDLPESLHDGVLGLRLGYREITCPGDFDLDGIIDTADLLYLLGAWGTPDGDIDGDGDTNTADLLALLGAWGECP